MEAVLPGAQHREARVPRIRKLGKLTGRPRLRHRAGHGPRLTSGDDDETKIAELK